MGNKHLKAAPLKFITTLLYSHFFDNFLCSILFQSFCWRKNHEQEPTNDKFTYSTRNVWFTNNKFILKAIYWLISSIFYAILMIEMRMHLLGVFLCCSHLFLYWHFWCAFDRNTFDQIDSLFVFCANFYGSARLWMGERVCESVWKLIFHFPMAFFGIIQPCTSACILCECVCALCSHVNFDECIFAEQKKKKKKKNFHFVEVMWRSVKCTSALESNRK